MNPLIVIGIIAANIAIIPLFYWFFFIRGARKMGEQYRAMVTERLLEPAQAAQRILAEGAPGEATVVSLADLHEGLGDDPMIQLALDVAPADGRSTYRAECKLLVSRLAVSRFQPGCRLAVKIDRRDPHLVAIEAMDISMITRALGG